MAVKIGQEQDIIIKIFNDFSAGLRYDFDLLNTGIPDLRKLPPNAIFDSINVFFDNGIIIKRTGYIVIQLNVAGDNSAIRWLDEWYDSTNQQHIMIITDTKFIEYNPNNNTFTDRTPVGGLFGLLSGPVSGYGFAGKYFMTNDVDKPFYWDGVAANAIFLTTAGAPTRASTVVGFASHLLWLNVNDAVLGYQPQEIVWSDFNNGLVYNSGDAAVVTIEDTNDVINAAEVMFNFLAIARDKSIYDSQFIGFPFFYRFDRRVEKDGIIAANTFRRTNQFVLGFSKNNNIIGFDGSNEQPYIGLPIKNDILNGIVDVNAYKNIRGGWKSFYEIAQSRWHMLVSHRSDGVPNLEYQYSLASEPSPIWSKHQYLDLVTALGTFTKQLAPTWNQLTNAWNTYTIRWNDTTVSQLNPIILLGDSTGDLYQIAPNTYSDNGVAISAYFKFMLKDLGMPNWIKELNRLQFTLTKQSVGILTVHVFESDDGFDFTEALHSPWTLDMTKSIIPYVDVMAQGEFFYLKVEDNNINETFEIREIRASFIPMYERIM